MFGVFKKFFNRSAARPEPCPSTPVSYPAAPEAEDGVPQNETLEGSAASAEAASEENVTISFTSIVRQMPKELHGKNSPSSSAKFCLPLRRVVDQLPHGAVRVPFKELRRAAPIGIFVSHSGHDDKLIDLPLREILPQLTQQAFTRRRQVRLEAPDDGTELFNRAGKPAAPIRVLQKEELLKTRSEPQPKEVSPPAPALTPKTVEAPRPIEAPKITFKPAPIAAAPIQPPTRRVGQPVAVKAPPQRVAAARVPAPAPLQQVEVTDDAIAVPLDQLSEKWPEAIRAQIDSWATPDMQCFLPMASIGAALRTGAVRFSWSELRSWISPAPTIDEEDNTPDAVLDIPLKLVAPLFMAKSRGPVQQKKAPALDAIPDVFSRHGVSAPTESEEEAEVQDEVETEEEDSPTEAVEACLSVSISLISQRWPDAIRKEITLLRLTEAKVEIPIETIENALKTGRFECHWKQICHWLKPCPTAALASAHADMRLDLPLNLLAPIYLKQRPATQAPQAPAEAPAQPAPVQEMAEEDVAPPQTVEEPLQARTLAELFGDPEKRNWTPNEIVHKTSSLAGVAGALMALQDGLLVASCMPPEWKSETIAAFLPQIFGRMKQYSKELKMGELESLTFSVEQGTFQIFNVGIIYFAALAKPTSTLPRESLKLIVRELARHTR